MAPERRQEWENFANSADIEPLGTPYGYQLEIPFSEPYYQRLRESQFFDDPRNIRGLFGDLSRDSAGNLRPLDERIQRAVEFKQELRNNPKLRQDFENLTSSPGGGSTTIGGLADAYSLRQLFGESPGEYGVRYNEANPSERGIYRPEQGFNTRIFTEERTDELSPRLRTFNTSPSLRPDRLAEDISLLGDPEVVRLAAPQETLKESPFLRAQRLLGFNFNQYVNALSSPIVVEATGNYDKEALRQRTTRSNLGITTVSGDFPGEFAENLQGLLNSSGADPQYIYDEYIRRGALPDEARAPRELLDEKDYDGPNVPSRSFDEFADINQGLSGSEFTDDKRASGRRIAKAELLSNYGNYLPANIAGEPAYSKLPLDEVQNIDTFLRSFNNTQLTDAARSFESNFTRLGPRGSIERLLDKSKDIQNQKQRQAVQTYLNNYLQDYDSKLIDVPIRSAGVGGSAYLNEFDVDADYPAAYKKLELFNETPYVPDDFEYQVKETFYSDAGDPYTVKINRVPQGYSSGEYTYSLKPNNLNASVAQMLEDKPYAGVYDISFSINDDYSDAGVPDELKTPIMQFVSNNFRQGIPGGAVLRNSPLGNEPSRTGREKGNKRSLWYQQMGFGAETTEGQYGYIDPESGDTVPIQPYRPTRSQGTETFKRSYYSLPPEVVVAQGLQELGRGLRQTPSALLPGAADLIPSPEAIRTGYQQGPVAMGQQMAQEFVQSLPSAAAAAGVLATPLAAPFAPGVGAGLVGTAAARAANEVVRQQTGEGIVSKLRQAIGTAPRTGLANSSRPRTAPRPLTAQVRPLTSAQRAEMNRQQNRNELQRRIDLAKERFNPAKLEFGLSELFRGR